MTTVTDFQPSATAAPPFQFQATLDGTQYNVAVTWNIFGRRWYIGIYDVSGTLILFRPLTGSGPKIQAVLTWDNWTATAALDSPHNVPVGSVANIDVTDTGLTYDGSFRALAVDSLTLTYQLPTDPQQYGVTGNVGQDVNLIGGQPSSYDSLGNPASFFSSTLIYRSGTQQFEVAP